MNAIFTRRSIRKFENRAVESDKLDRILRAGMQAPSAHNKQPWEFLVITSQDKRDFLSKVTPYTGNISKAPVCIVVLGEMGAERIKAFIQQDLSAATQNILLQTAEEGLGGLWMGLFPDEKRVSAVTEYLNLPENIIPFALIAIGHSEVKNEFTDRYKPEKIHWEEY
jgi:nitroreductase